MVAGLDRSEGNDDADNTVCIEPRHRGTPGYLVHSSLPAKNRLLSTRPLRRSRPSRIQSEVPVKTRQLHQSLIIKTLRESLQSCTSCTKQLSERKYDRREVLSWVHLPWPSVTYLLWTLSFLQLLFHTVVLKPIRQSSHLHIRNGLSMLHDRCLRMIDERAQGVKQEIAMMSFGANKIGRWIKLVLTPELWTDAWQTISRLNT